MAGTPEGQGKKGHLLEDSPNVEKKTGRSDGTTGGQKTIGHLADDSKNAEQRTRPDSGFIETQGPGSPGKGEGDPEPTNPSKQGDRIGAQPIGGDE
jgi:hypothetical protein